MAAAPSLAWQQQELSPDLQAKVTPVPSNRFSCLLMLLLLLTGACTSEAPPEKATDETPGKTSVTLQLNWLPEPQFGGIYQARLDGSFAAEGLEVEVVPGSAGVSAPQLADNGNVDFAIVGGSQILQLNDRGGSLVALFAVYQHDPHGIMVLEDAPFESLAQLWSDPKATIGCEAELAFVREIIRTYGTEDGAKLVAYNPPAFRSGAQQASQCFVTSEPVALQLEGVATRVFMSNETGFDPYNTVLVTRRAYLEANPETCRAMVRAFTSGWTAYLADPASTNAELVKLNPSMSIEAMNLSAARQLPLIQDDATRASGLGSMTRERWSTLAGQLKGMDIIDAVPDIDSIFQWERK